jgi:hypothetical protein
MRRLRTHFPALLLPVVLVAAAAVAGIAVNLVLLGFGPPATDRVGHFKPDLELAASRSTQEPNPTRRNDAADKKHRRSVKRATSSTTTTAAATPRSIAPIGLSPIDDGSATGTRGQEPGASDDD